jgi:hypothetical protein
LSRHSRPASGQAKADALSAMRYSFMLTINSLHLYNVKNIRNGGHYEFSDSILKRTNYFTY